MRIVAVHPGPDWSVADCHRGYVEAFKALGQTVVEFDTGARLDFYEAALLEDADNQTVRAAFPDATDQAVLVSKDLESVLYETWPDLIWVTYGTCVDPRTLQLARRRGHTVVIHHTEAPYEDERGIKWAAAGVADLWLINDPTNIERWRQAWPHVTYLPHSYRPTVHRLPRQQVAPLWDAIWIGSSFPSRVEWFTRFVEAAQIDLALAGNWMNLADSHPLVPHILNGNHESLDNTEVPGLYHQARIGLNMYRRETEDGATADGWAMGPREVEMAACGLFYLTEPRGENRERLPMLPTFESPEDAAEQAAWWTAHDKQRRAVALDARAAIADWTFERRAVQVLTLLEQLNAAA
ncbi:MAG: glycosyltransferase [Acidimicrobiia bacterium]|nr:glycosyltransferase [Acidimicrobiia bacterium]